MATLALIEEILSVIQGAEVLLPRLFATAQQSGELTPEQEASLEARMNERFGSTDWKVSSAKS